MGFLSKVGEAEAALTPANILAPEAAKALLDSTPDALLLDVQDPGSDMAPGSHSASLGTLFFKASTDLADFKDPKIADRPKDGLIVCVTLRARLHAHTLAARTACVCSQHTNPRSRA